MSAAPDPRSQAPAGPRRSRALGIIGCIVVAITTLLVNGGLLAFVVLVWLHVHLTDAIAAAILIPVAVLALLAIVGWVVSLIAGITGRGRVAGFIGVGLGVLGGIITIVVLVLLPTVFGIDLLSMFS